MDGLKPFKRIKKWERSGSQAAHVLKWHAQLFDSAPKEASSPARTAFYVAINTN
jgi:hypothetical protein